ncbi:hypothetical protein EDB86DRAFT_2838053 [Lactarius hatsudake]|nr:hypothetical protein EDB86DRAFT_2838053 [Lactarius hatsudake]
MPFKLWLPQNNAVALSRSPGGSTLALVRPVRISASARLPPRVITVDSPHQHHPYSKPIPKVVWKGLKGTIESLVARTTAMGWHIRLDMRVHLNIANGLRDVVDRSFEPIRFELSRGIEATPSVEGADQV